MATPSVSQISDQTRSEGWCYTLNNYTMLEHTVMLEIPCAYHIVGQEVSESGTPHMQGYIHFSSQKTLKRMKKYNTRAHWEKKRGTVAQAADYCKKEGNFEERGTRPASQAEKGLKGAEKIADMWALAKAGKIELLPVSMVKTAEYVFAKFGPKPIDRPILDNIWIWGPSGCGKSRRVRDENPSFYSKPMSKWWDGYAHEDVVLLDDFAPEHGKFLAYFLKIWADHYVFNAEVKGGMLRIRPLRVIVTSQYPLHACFEEEQTISALTRRFKIERMGETPAQAVFN